MMLEVFDWLLAVLIIFSLLGIVHLQISNASAGLAAHILVIYLFSIHDGNFAVYIVAEKRTSLLSVTRGNAEYRKSEKADWLPGDSHIPLWVLPQLPKQQAMFAFY